MNARKAIERNGHGVIGVTATIGRSDGRAKIVSAATHHARAVNREVTVPIDARRAIALPAHHAKAVGHGRTGVIAGRLERVRGRPARVASLAENVSGARIAQADRAAEGRRDSETGRARRGMAIGRAASIGRRAIDPKGRRAIGNDSVRHGIAIGRARRGSATARVRRAGRGRPVAAEDSGREVPVAIAEIVQTAIVHEAAVQAVGLRAPGRKAAHHARHAGRGRRVRAAIVRPASVATRSSAT